MSEEYKKSTPKYVRDFSGLLLEDDLSEYDRHTLAEFEINQTELSHLHPEAFEEEGAEEFFADEYEEDKSELPRGIVESNATDQEKAVAAYMWENGKTLCGRDLNWPLYFMAPFKRDIDCVRKFIDVGTPRLLINLDDDAYRLVTDKGEFKIVRGIFWARLYGVMPLTEDGGVCFRNVQVLATLASYGGNLHDSTCCKEMRTLPETGKNIPLMSEKAAWNFLYKNHLPDYMALIPEYGKGIWFDSIELKHRIKEPEWFRFETALLFAFCCMRNGATPEHDMGFIFNSFLNGLGIRKEGSRDDKMTFKPIYTRLGDPTDPTFGNPFDKETYAAQFWELEAWLLNPETIDEGEIERVGKNWLSSEKCDMAIKDADWSYPTRVLAAAMEAKGGELEKQNPDLDFSHLDWSCFLSEAPGDDDVQ